VPAVGLHDFSFRLFDAETGGAQLGATLCVNDVNVLEGLLTVTLDFGSQFSGAPRFLELAVRADSGLDCGISTGFTVLAPRQAVMATPQALFALSTNAAASAATASNSAQLNGQPASFYQDATNLSSGTIPAARLPGTVVNLPATAATPVAAGTALSITNSSTEDNSDGLEATAIAFNSTALTGRSTGDESTAIRGVAEGGDSTGVLGVANSSAGSSIGVSGGALGPGGIGVSGHNGATTGTGQGVRGVSASRDGRGVVGIATHPAEDFGVNYGVYGESAGLYGCGVFGHATYPIGDGYGGRFEVESPQGFAVYAIAHGTAAGTSHGLFAQSDSISGTGVTGYASHFSGDTRGVYGHSNSPTGRGVYGLAASASGQAYGVYGQTHSSTGAGVYGFTDTNSPTAYGVLGFRFSPGYAIYAIGDIGAFGTKSFRIDHPDDPANKYLLHYAAESPEVINFYSGKVMLDASGQARVELPRYFAAINKDPRYTLTAIGAPMPMLHVAEEIDEAALRAGAVVEPGEAAPPCSFRIAGGAPGGKVSWRVEAVRNDRWVQKHGAPVEVEKQGVEKGTYQFPELYGKPREAGLHYSAPARNLSPVIEGAAQNVRHSRQ
jgi:hypothetical protein